MDIVVNGFESGTRVLTITDERMDAGIGVHFVQKLSLSGQLEITYTSDNLPDEISVSFAGLTFIGKVMDKSYAGYNHHNYVYALFTEST